ncbi:MAG: HAD hydrolase-like protein [Nitrospirae bacterium]|nr:HAD hydrolase-like protein [Nitrospirota bacterium]
MNRLVLFDIDGTLIDSGQAGTRALDRTFLDLYGLRNAFEGIEMAGKTDVQIIRECLGVHGLSADVEEVDRVIRTYVDLLAEEIDNPRRSVMAGVVDLLETLKADGVAMGLLTGNIEEGARIKLESLGLYGYFPAGAFGSDHEDRDMLLPVAVKRFSALGIDVPPERCVVIGDTPRDVRCARVHGASCIAVSTGSYSGEELIKAGADLVVESLEDKEACLRFMTSADSV